MEKTKAFLIFAFLSILLLSSFAGPAFAGAHDLVVIRPGGPTASDEAQGQVTSLIKQIARQAGWTAESATARYFNKEDEGVQYLSSNKPGFALITPGIYLKYRQKFGLTPINKIIMSNSATIRYHIVARKGTAKSLADLKGKILAGAHLAEPEYVQKVVLENALILGKDVTIKAVSGLSALRSLKSGEVFAVLLDDKELASLPSLPFANQFETIFSCRPITNTGIMLVGKNAGAADVEALARACRNFCASAEGKAVCDTFEINGFEPTTPDAYADLLARWGK